MIWLPNHKVLYLNAPKAGSVTVCNALIDYCRLNDVSYKRHTDYDLAGMPDWDGHPNRRTFENKLISLGIFLDDSFVFTTIRNPWLRVRSHFRFARYDANQRPWWNSAYDPQRGYLKQSDWLFSNSKVGSWLPYKPISKFEVWSRYYRFSSYARSVHRSNSTRAFRIEDELDQLAGALDQRLPGFLSMWESRSCNLHNVGDHMFIEKHGAAPKYEVQFSLCEKAISRISRFWTCDIAQGKYTPP